MRLAELTLPPTRQDAGVILRKAGYEPLGKGAFATVWAKPGEPFALKLFASRDQAYIAFVRLVQANPNPHFPTMRGNLIKITDQYSGVRVERLAPPPTRYWQLIRACADYLGARSLIDEGVDVDSRVAYVKKFRFGNDSLSRAIDLIYDEIIRGNRNMMDDISVRNCRVRGNTLVFIDPVAWGGGPQVFGEQRVDELFTAPAPVQETGPGKYTFTVGNQVFDVEFLDRSGEAEVTFKRMDAANPMDQFSTQGDFGRPPTVVYATIVSLMQQYLKQHQPEKLIFYGADDRQAEWYHKAIPLLSRLMPKNYDIEFVKGKGLYPDWIEIVRNYNYIGESEITPTPDEEKEIAQDNHNKKRLRVRDLFYVNMPGIPSYPALGG